MIKFLRSHLFWKIFGTYMLVILAAGLIIFASMNLFLGSALGRHKEGMEHMMPPMIFINGRGIDLIASYRSAMNESLAFSAVVAFALAVVASLLLSQRVTNPVKTMMGASQQIAQGDYRKRVPSKDSKSGDELDQLAISFNQMAEKLQQIEEMRRQLLADVSHELRTPLTAIKGSMEGLMDNVLPADRDTYESVYREADRLQRLVEDLQELSRVQSSGLSLNKTKVQIKDVIKVAVQQMQPALNKKKISLSIEMESKLPLVQADEDRILQVLINLLSNAQQFTPKNGQVRIDARADKKEIIVSVKDSGLGIRSSDLSRIFERFYRSDKSRTRAEGGGSGIGLTIAQTLVHAHGGRIWAESAGEGQGSIFYFSLPISK